ncbi:NAD(P)/FAD-dependent oxidoreductase [Paenisporosarcina cavernae]|uniref:Ferredoxin--NADP reductase n=1 Tax=Paenisporosarcina cavernae TaxID=2320858 RepID=A0A385YQ69_9BACL|nr:NAD(P)/FAD-dependent oxidoreductase [Paenisporosarcina cavernae]AYC28601.1 NAD(P)/FAD-dependent oxidoreductase [Paenisporosarcina cavernae]
MKTVDCVIVGAGPAGLFTAFYAGMRDLDVTIIESLPNVGGQLTALYPEKYIYDVAGFPKVRAKDLVDNLMEQLAIFSPTICLNESVKDLTQEEDGTWKVTTSKSIHLAKTVIFTTGNGAFEPKRLEKDDTLKWEGSQLHYFVDDMHSFAGKNVVLFGGGDSAVDWALMLEPIAKQVTLVHRRDEFRAHEHSLKQLEQSSVKKLTPYVFDSFKEKDGVIRHVAVRGKDGDLQLIPTDHIIVNYGFRSSIGEMANWGMEMERHAIVVNSQMETSLPGVYAVGDSNTYPGKVKLIACGFGEAPIAVNAAKHFIDPATKKHVKHSTDLFTH